jgi:hypothetical protein
MAASPAGLRRLALGLAPLALASVLATGCDIVQGFQDAGNALFPPVKTYLEAPGFRLVTGGYRYLSLIASSELFLLARSSRPGDEGLYSMRYADPRPCEIPDVGRYWAGGGLVLPRAYIAWLPPGQSRGTLSFADEHCRRATFTLPEAELPPLAVITPPEPVPRGTLPARSLVLRSQGNLVALSGDAESAELLLENAGPTLDTGSALYVYTEGRVAAFDKTWKLIDTFGDTVVAWGSFGGKLFYEDESGISRVTVTSSGGAPALDVEAVGEGACLLGFPSDSERWVSMQAPCGGALELWDDRAEKRIPLGFETDPRLLRLLAPAKVSRPDPSKDALWAFFLREPDWSAGVGTLVVRNLDGEEHVLGERAALERASIDKTDTFGYALVDVAGETGTFVRWEPDGAVASLADGTLRDSPNVGWAELIVDWDGISGTLAHVVNDRVERFLDRIPRRKFTYKDLDGRVALFHDYDGTLGTLSIGVFTCPGGGTTCSDGYYAPRPIAQNVFHPRHDFLDADEDFLPGIAYLADYDVLHDTGRFEYRNLELGFTSIVNEGVSDFLYAGNGLLYSVPFGDQAGIWLARAK